MTSELRKSLESINSLLGQTNSPITSTSLSSRMNRASAESSGGLESVGYEEGSRSSSVSFRPHGGLGLGSGNSNGVGGGLLLASSSMTSSLSLAPIAEPGTAAAAGHHLLAVSSSATTPSSARASLLSPRTTTQQSRDSLSYTPFNDNNNNNGPGANIMMASMSSSATSTPHQAIDTGANHAGGDGHWNQSILGIFGREQARFDNLGRRGHFISSLWRWQ